MNREEQRAILAIAATDALGQLARRYYAGGRKMNTATFHDRPGPARQLQTQCLPEIRQRAATLDAGNVMSSIRA